VRRRPTRPAPKRHRPFSPPKRRAVVEDVDELGRAPQRRSGCSAGGRASGVAREIIGRKTAEIAALLGYRGRDEPIHRAAAVLL
jgi:hypothetical protein